jgi:hypothetical protein
MNKQEAIATGAARYETGEPCKHGHVSERYVASGDCVACHRARNSLDHFKNKEPDPMIAIIDQIRSLNEQLNEVRNQIGRPALPPPKRIPQARCISMSFSVARLTDNRCGPLRDDETHTKVSVLEEAKKIAQRTCLPIRYLNWQTDLSNVTGPDSVAIVERLHVSTNDGDPGRHPTTKWAFSSAPPAWLKFNDATTSEVNI